jgi:hypothetical protein
MFIVQVAFDVASSNLKGKIVTRTQSTRKPSKPTIEYFERRLLLSSGGSAISLTTDPTGVSSQLIALTQEGSAAPENSELVYDSSGRVEVKITADDVNALETPLAALGFQLVGAEPDQHYLEGFIPTAALTTIDSLTAEGLLGVLPAFAGQTLAGKIDTEGDSVLEADRTRAATGDSGAGVTVGVLSDSYNNLGTAAADVASGDLPSNVNVVQDLSSGGTDEGRAMLQIVHDLAPGASLAFATGFNGEASFASNILKLASPVSSGGAGANIICDDVVYTDEPYFQDGTIANAANNAVTTDNVSYFVAAGNFSTQSYESTTVAFNSATIPGISSSAGKYYNFNTSGTAVNEQNLTLGAGQTLGLGLEWDQPYYTTSGVTSQINMYLLNHSNGAVVASGTYNTIADQEPFQYLYYDNPATVAGNYDLVISLASGTVPGRIKYVNRGSGGTFNDFATNSPTVVPHAAAVNAMAVAAAPSVNQRTLESFSSEGPSTILFNSSGGRYTTPQVRAKPDITATDDVSTTFFYYTGGFNGYPTFPGTSCAVAHAAGVAALIKDADPTWTPAQIYADMKATADPNIVSSGGTNDANFSGAGLIDAYRAVVGNAAPAVATVNDGFESGYLGQDWTTYNSGAGQTEVETGNSPASGSYQLIEDGITSGYIYPVLSEAILNLNVPSYASNVVLNFSQKKFYNPNYSNTLLDYPMPPTFTGHGDYEGVALSVDGTHWYSLISLTGGNSTTAYQAHTINLSQAAAADGLTLGATVQIKFQYYDADSYRPTNGGFAFDNISTTVALAFTGPAYYFKLDVDLSHLDIWNSNSTSGTIYASLLASQISSILVTGTGTPQNVTVDFTKGDPIISGLSFNASSPVSSQLNVIGTATGNDAVTASTGSISINGTSIKSTNAGLVSFTPGTGTDVLSINSGALQLSRRGGSGIDADLFSTITVASGASISIAAPATQATRTLIDTSSLVLAGRTNAWTGTLNLNSNDLAVTAGNLSTITNQLASGYNNSWTGTGITSSAAAADSTHLSALGAISNMGVGSSPLYSTFDGSNTSAAAVLVKYTYYGDANLDGQVDGSDYSKIDNGFLTRLTGWTNGDFNYDGSVNGSDYTLIDNAFNRQGASLAAQIAGALYCEKKTDVQTRAASVVQATFSTTNINFLGSSGAASMESWMKTKDVLDSLAVAD